ncbi:MAG TPA: hypothetical protein PK294_10880 [Ignavibacteria bacterium]|nr:hypothetical protein [Ignavibacteria bacterium]HQY51978.1 hypothetical protein [Ignavibacteria bacterium]HRB00929.1 hypothetical protein [Ignavibacteria bacterium]
MKTLSILAMILFIFSGNVFSQDKININNEDYKFKFNLPAGWTERKVEETNKNDAISYTFDRDDGKIAIMLLAFKVNEVKNLDDFVYTLEKDLTLNIPKKDGSYKDFDSGNYDGKSCLYQDSEFTEILYYYRTKIAEGNNYTYLLRFIVPSSRYHSEIDADIRKLAEKFTPDV